MKQQMQKTRNILKKHRKAMIGAAILILAAGAWGIRSAAASRTASAEEPGTETAVIERMDLTQSLTLSGTVQSGATYSVTSPVTDVEVKAVYVKEGDRVQKGDVIAVLDDSQLQEGRKSAKDNLDYTKKKNSQDVSAARRSLQNAREDQTIQADRGDRDVREASGQVDKAQKDLKDVRGKLQTAQSDRDKAQKALEKASAEAAPAREALPVKERALTDERKAAELKETQLKELEDLAEQGEEVPEEEFEAAQKAYDDAMIKLAAIQTEYDALREKIDAEEDAREALNAAKEQVSDLQTQVRSAEEAVDAAKSSLTRSRNERDDANRTAERAVEEQRDALSSAKLSAKESLKSPEQELSKADKELEQCVVRAETDGVVTSVSVKPGSVYKGDSIAVIDDDSSYRVTATVDQYDISSLAEGQYTDITVKAAGMEDVPGRMIHVARAPVVSAEGEVSSSGGAEYRVETLIIEPGDQLKIGMTAKVVVKVWEKKDCLAVPDACVQTDENGERYVEVMDESGAVTQVPVRYGMKTDYYSEISGDGIEEGLTVVIPAAEMEDGEFNG